MNTNWKNRTLFHGDNLAFLRAMNSESVDLIATDPPFNKGRDFHATPDSLAAGAKFQDRWSWDRDVHEEWTDQITDDYPRLMEAIESARYAHSDGMGAYMCFMAVRLLAMRRVLKPTGLDLPALRPHRQSLSESRHGRDFRVEAVSERDRVVLSRRRSPAKRLLQKTRSHSPVLEGEGCYVQRGRRAHPVFGFRDRLIAKPIR